MIGRKVFSKSNFNSGPAANQLGEAIISSGPATPPPMAPSATPVAGNPAAPTAPATSQPKSKLSPKLVAIIIASAIVGAGIAVSIVFLVKSLSDKESTATITVYDYAPGNDGSETVEETLNEFDQKIESSKDAEETFSLTLAKATYHMINSDYDSALTVLNGVDASSLDDYDLYRLYNHYASAYEGKGNASEAARYQQLADDASARDFGSATEEAKQ